MNSVDLINSIINSPSIDTSNEEDINSIQPYNSNQLSQQGYSRAAANQTLNPDDLARYDENRPYPTNLLEAAMMGRGAYDYATDNAAMDKANTLDYGQALLGGIGEGAASTLMAPAAMAVGANMDVVASLTNNALKRAGLPEIAHNYMGEMAGWANKTAKGFGDLIRSDEQSQYAQADKAKRAIRQHNNNLQYKRDLEKGMGEGEAGIRDFFRNVWTGVENFTDSPTNVIDTTGQLMGELAVQGGIAKGLNKALGLSKSKAGKIATGTASTVLTEAASGIGEAAEAIDKLTDKQLLNNSPEFRELYAYNLAQGKTYEQAIKDARTELKRQASVTEALGSGMAALVGAKFARPIDNFMPNANAASSLLRDSFSEGIEEAITGFGQGISSNLAAQQTYNPNQRLMEGVGAQTSEGALAGAAGSAALRTPSALMQGYNDIQEELAALKQEKEDETLQSVEEDNNNGTAPETNNTNTITIETGDDEGATEDISFKESETADGKKNVIFDDPVLNNPLTASQELRDKYEMGDNDNALLLLKKIANKVKEAQKNKDTDTALDLMQEYNNIYKDVYSNLAKNRTVSGELVSQGKLDPTSNQQSMLSAVYNGIQGNELQGSTSREKQQYLFASSLTDTYIAYQDELNKVNTAAQAAKSDKKLKAFTSNVANGSIDVDDKEVQGLARTLQNKKTLTKAEQAFKAVYDAVSYAKEKGISLSKHGGLSLTNQNVFSTSIDYKMAVQDMMTAINNAITSENKKEIAKAMQRLSAFAVSRGEKVGALQRALKEGNANPVTYTSISPRDLAPYDQEVSLGSFALYDAIQDEQEDIGNIYNKYVDILNNYKLNQDLKGKPFKKVKVLPKLANEDQLKEAFKKKNPNTKNSIKKTHVEASEPSQESSDTPKSTDVPKRTRKSRKKSTEPSDVAPKEDITEPVKEPSELEVPTDTDTDVDENEDTNTEIDQDRIAREIVANLLKKKDEDTGSNTEPKKETTKVKAKKSKNKKTTPKKEEPKVEEDIATNEEIEEESEEVVEDTVDTVDNEDNEDTENTEDTEVKEETKETEDTDNDAEVEAEIDDADSYNDADVIEEVTNTEDIEGKENKVTAPFIEDNVTLKNNNVINSIKAFMNLSADSWIKFNKEGYNHFNSVLRQHIFTKRFKEHDKAKLSFKDKYTSLFNNYLEKRGMSDDYAISFRNDKNKFNSWINDFKDFNKAVLDPSNEGKVSLNLTSWIKKQLDNGTNAAYITMGVKKDSKGNIEWPSNITDRLITLFTNFDNKGNLAFNEEVESAMAVASFIVQQRIENRSSPRDASELEIELTRKGLDVQILNDLRPLEQLSVLCGTSLNSVIDQLKSTFLNVLNVKGVKSIPKSFDADTLAAVLSLHTLRFMMQRGDLSFNSYYFSPYKERLTEEEARHRSDSITLSYATPTIVIAKEEVKRKKKKAEKEGVEVEVGEPAYKGNTFETPLLEDALLDAFMYEPEKDVYYSEADLPKAAKQKLRSPSLNTEAEKSAIEVRIHRPYYLDTGYHSIVESLGLEGVLKVADLDEDPKTDLFNTTDGLSYAGKRLGLIREYQVNMQRAQNVLTNDSSDLAIYLNGNMHRAGRYQEDTPSGSQASKFMRYMFSHVKATVDITDTNGSLIGFKRAVLQAFGKKIKRLTDSQVEELFNNLESAFMENYASSEEFLTSLIDSPENIKKAYEIFGKALKGEKENPWIALSALINTARYLDAVHTEGQTSFVNTLPLEFDGSCNGFANAWMKLALSDEFTEQNFTSMYRSQMFFGLDNEDSHEAWKTLPSDNYTGNADATQEAISERLSDLILASKYPYEEFSTEFKNVLTKQTETVSHLDLAIDTLNFIGYIMGDAIKVNEAAISSANIKKTDSLIAIARVLIKFPTTRINYGQGLAESNKQFISDLDEVLVKRLTNVVRNYDKPPYLSFFAEEIAKGDLTEEQALDNFNKFILTFYRLNNILAITTVIERREEYTVKLRKASKQFGHNFFRIWKKDDLLTPEMITTLADFSLKHKGAYTDVFSKNIKKFFTDLMYKSVDESRNIGYKLYTSLLPTVSNVSAAIKQSLIQKQVEDYIKDPKHLNLLPSENKVGRITSKINSILPTTLTTKSVNLDMAGTTKIGINNFTIKGRDISNLEVNNPDSPLNGMKVITALRAESPIKVPNANGIAPVANSTIGFGDGNMQTLYFNDKEADPHAVDRYDGVDTDTNLYANNSITINRAAYNILDELPTKTLLRNTIKLNKKMHEMLDNDPNEDNLMLVIKVLREQDRDFDELIKHEKECNRKLVITKNYIFIYINKYVNIAKFLHKSALINTSVLKSLPVSMQHMSAGPTGYNIRNSKDTFEVPAELTMDQKIAIVAKEANRRRKIVEKNFAKVLHTYNSKGIILVPNAVYKNIPNVAIPKPNERDENDPNDIVVAKPETHTKELPNNRTKDATVDPTASLDEAPKRETTQVQPQATNTSGESTGRFNEDFQDYIKDFCKRVAKENPELESTLGHFFKGFLNNNIPAELKVHILTDADDPYYQRISKIRDMSNTTGFYFPSDKVIILNRVGIENFSLKEENETLIHELVHAVVASKLSNALNHKEHPAHMAAKKLARLKTTVGNRLKKDNPALYMSLKDLIFEHPNADTQIQEFVAYMLTDPELIKYAKDRSQVRTKDAKSLYDYFKDIIKYILHIKEKDFKSFLSFYGQTVLYTTAVVNTPLVETKPVPTVVQSVAYGSNDERLTKIASKLADVINKLNITESDKIEANMHIQSSAMKFINFSREARLPLSDKAITVGAYVAELYNGVYDLNSSILLDAMELRRSLLKKLKKEDLVLPSEGKDTHLAEIRYNFLKGISDNSTDSSEYLGYFMALLTISPEIRDILSKVYEKNTDVGSMLKNTIHVSDSPLDIVLTKLGNSVVTEINSLIDDVHGYARTRKPLKATIDRLSNNLMDIEKKASILDKPQAMLDRGNAYISNSIDKAGTALLTSKTLEKMFTSDSKALTLLAAGLKVTVPLILKDTNKFFIQNRDDIIHFVNTYGVENPSFLSRLMTSALKELREADENADSIYETGKIVKAIVQASRNIWREVTPLKLKSKYKEEGVVLTKSESASLNTVILTADLGVFTESDLHTLFTGSLNREITKRKNAINSNALAKAKQLAHYMATGEASNGMLRNATAISIRTKESNSRAIDELVTLLVLKAKEEDFKVAKDVYARAPEAFNFSVAQQRQNRALEASIAEFLPERRLNIFKGYYPQDIVTSADVQVVKTSAVKQYLNVGYKVIGTTRDGLHAYVSTSTNPKASFSQGALQTVISVTGGIDEFTGWSPNNKVFSRIANPKSVEQITASLPRLVHRKESYIPVLDYTGSRIVGYEITVNPDMYTTIQKETDFAKNLGGWRGRQVEEEIATDVNKLFIDTLIEQYEEAVKSGDDDQYVNVLALAEKDPVLRDSLSNLSPKVKEYLSVKTKFPKEWYIRQDLVEDVIGRRQASIVDLQTGTTRWDPAVQKAITQIVKSILGNKGFAYLYKAESILKSTSSSLRNFIVIRSGEVMVTNIISNILSLMLRGVSITTIMKETPKIIKELEHYNRSRQRQAILFMELNAEKGKDHPSVTKIRELQARINEEAYLIDKLTYSRDLLRAGEYNTIADIGDVSDDLLLSTGKFGEYIEKQVNKFPSILKEAGRQLIVTKDTAIYRVLEKGTQYGDFVAKAIYYRHLKENKKLDKDAALSKIRYEFVNYDMLPGRSREYLENIGLLWFYNYKLRISRVAMSMLKENPLNALLSLVSPINLGVGTPITDNFLVKLFTSPSSSVGMKLFDIPWVTNHLWYNIFN